MMLTLPQPALLSCLSSLHFRSLSSPHTKSLPQDESLKQLLAKPHVCSILDAKYSSRQRRASTRFMVAAKSMAEQPSPTGDDKASAREKLQRLEMLLIKINAAVEVSEKHAAVGNSHLVRRRDALKEAASEGDEALAFFTRRAVTRSSNEELGYAASSPAAGSLFFTWSALSLAMAWRVRDSSKNILFCGDDDNKRLDIVVEKLEQLLPDVADFIGMLQIEILPKIEHTWPLTRKSAPPPCLLPPHYGVETRWPAEAWMWIPDSPEYEDYKAWVALLRRLSALVVGGRIDWAVGMVWGRDMDIGGGGSGALAQWAAVLREAERRGLAVLLNADRCLVAECSCFYGDEPPPRCALGRARDQVRRVVRGLEILADDVESFGGLAVLCPWDFSVR